MDEDQNSENVQVTPQDQDSTVVDENAQEEVLESAQGQEETSQDRNWGELRRKAEQSEQKARELEEKSRLQDQFIKNLMEQTQQNQPVQKEEVDEFKQLSSEEYLTLGQTEKMLEKRSRAYARDEFNQLSQQREQERFKERLQAKYSDFDEVVNSETIAILEKKEPELAATIADLKDPYKMGMQTYKFISSMNLAGSKSERKHAEEVSKNIKKNEETIQSPHAYDKRPMAKAFDILNMSKKEKEDLFRETLGYASKAPGY